jgi:hypothetical protein
MKQPILIILLFLTSCQGNPVSEVHLSVDKKLRAVKITGLTTITLQGIKRDTITTEAWQSLFPVYAMPADTSLRNYQRPLHGRYVLTNNAILFTPDTAFSNGQTYFVRYYHYDKPITAIDLLLHRRALGRGTYTELIFKY